MQIKLKHFQTSPLSTESTKLYIERIYINYLPENSKTHKYLFFKPIHNHAGINTYQFHLSNKIVLHCLSGTRVHTPNHRTEHALLPRSTAATQTWLAPRSLDPWLPACHSTASLRSLVRPPQQHDATLAVPSGTQLQVC